MTRVFGEMGFSETGFGEMGHNQIMITSLAAWHSGRMPVFDRRTFHVPHSTYS